MKLLPELLWRIEKALPLTWWDKLLGKGRVIISNTGVMCDDETIYKS